MQGNCKKINDLNKLRYINAENRQYFPYLKDGEYFFMRKFSVICSVFALAAAAFISLARPEFYGYDGRRETYFENGSFSEGIRAEESLGLYELIRGRCGEAVLTDEETAEKIVKDFGARLVYKESVSGGENAYYYTEKLPFSAAVNGKTVNLQIFRSRGAVKAGTPIIYGGF